MSQHAVLSPSGASTWMTCPGSAAMQRGLADTANDYSDEGTAAHLLGSTCLESGEHPQDYLGLAIEVGASPGFDGAVWLRLAQPEGFVARRAYTVDAEMAEQVAKYVDRVRQYQGDGILLPEQRVSIEPFTGEAGAAGTSDAVVVRDSELVVIDLKFGMGVRVNAERNKQLMIYALGARAELDMAYGPFERIRFVISQPRLDHLSEWDCSAAELDAFAAEVREKAGGALEIYRSEGLPHVDFLRPSEDACRWCKAKATCPALSKFVTDATAMDFEALAPDPVPATGYFDPADLARKMAACGLIEDWIKAIRAEVERQLFAGTAIPGYKIVQGKKGNRAWSDTEKADALLKTMRMPMEDRYKMTLLSPPAIEKALKATPKRWARVLKADLIEQRDGQPSVAPESDKRPVWTPPDTASDFTAVSEEESMV